MLKLKCSSGYYRIPKKNDFSKLASVYLDNRNPIISVSGKSGRKRVVKQSLTSSPFSFLSPAPAPPSHSSHSFFLCSLQPFLLTPLSKSLGQARAKATQGNKHLQEFPRVTFLRARAISSPTGRAASNLVNVSQVHVVLLNHCFFRKQHFFSVVEIFFS